METYSTRKRPPTKDDTEITRRSAPHGVILRVSPAAISTTVFRLGVAQRFQRCDSEFPQTQAALAAAVQSNIQLLEFTREAKAQSPACGPDRNAKALRHPKASTGLTRDPVAEESATFRDGTDERNGLNGPRESWD